MSDGAWRLANTRIPTEVFNVWKNYQSNWSTFIDTVMKELMQCEHVTQTVSHVHVTLTHFHTALVQLFLVAL